MVFWLGAFLVSAGVFTLLLMSALTFFPAQFFRAMEWYEERFEKPTAPKRWFP
jgi:hypothetical protein